jgi:cystathionine beta-lyase/cystathionine gamma-synthase
MGFSTDAVHAGQRPDPTTGAVITPIYQTSTYRQDELGRHKGYEYARTQNPTREALEANVAALESGEHGVAFASGLAAIGAVVDLLGAGDHVVVTRNVYGGTYRVFQEVRSRFGVEFSYVDTARLDLLREAIRPQTRMIFVETPTNPMMSLTDIAASAEIARENDCRLVVDNTFMSPYFQRPLELGAHLVLHSTTKYLNGHSDMVGGLVVARDEAVAERLRFLQNAVGAVPGPFDCWLALRGTKTLALRMRQHDANARVLAAMLAEHPKVVRIYYPGLPDHPQHELASRQCSGFGGMISFDVGGLEQAGAVLANTRIFSLAESLGGVESLISHPATMTHASVPRKERESFGVTDGLVRISVGIEDVEDLEEDLRSALNYA